MTKPTHGEALRALIVKWREQAECFDEVGTTLLKNRAGAAIVHEKQRVRDAYLRCAADLSAAFPPEGCHPEDQRLSDKLHDWLDQLGVPRRAPAADGSDYAMLWLTTRIRRLVEGRQEPEERAVSPALCPAVHVTHPMSAAIERIRTLAARTLAGASKRNDAYALAASVIDQIEQIETAISTECETGAEGRAPTEPPKKP